MPRLTIDLTMSLDGYVAGPDPSLADPLGEGGERLHEWAFAASAWQAAYGHEGGEAGQDADVIQEHLDAIGASIMGRKGGGSGPWEDDPKARTFHFVTDGPEAALEQAQAAAGGKDVHVAGGAQAVQQYLRTASPTVTHFRYRVAA